MGELVVHGGVPPERVFEVFAANCEKRFRRAMLAVEGEARRRSPIRTGHLRQSITSTVRRAGMQFTGYVGTTTLYAPYLEYGTGIYGPKHRPIVPVKAQALRFPAGFTSSVFTGGQRTRGTAGRGFRLSGQQRAGKAGASAGYVFARSVRGIHPMHFFEEAIHASQTAVIRELEQAPADTRRELGLAA